MPNSFTAQAFITTDIDDNQIIAFHPGAMSESHQNHVTDAKDVGIGIIAPDGRTAMIQHAEEFHAAGIPFIFDPGQALPLYDGPELNRFIELADYVTVNDYEAKLLEERTGETVATLASRCKALIVTLGALGSHIHTDGKVIEIPCVPPAQIVDPTGCGDAYRAGILFGIQSGWGWEKTGRLASLLGAIKIAQRGGQNHHFTRSGLADQFRAAFGGELWQGEKQ